MPIINRFDGGIVTGVDSRYLKDDMSIVLVDAHIDRLGLISAPVSQKHGRAERYFYQFPVLYIDDEGDSVPTNPESYFITSSHHYRTYAEFEGKLCYSDGGPQCKMTEGIMNDAGTDFKWLDMGVAAPDGKVVARPITVLEDIAGSAVSVNSNSGGYINSEVVRYRIVDMTNDDPGDDTHINPVYIHDIEYNPGGSKVTFTLPDSNFIIYREIVDEYDNQTELFVEMGTGPSFVDGTMPLKDTFQFLSTSIVGTKASYRLSNTWGITITVPYIVAGNTGGSLLSIPAYYELSADDTFIATNIGIKRTTDAISEGIASGFTLNNKLYVMTMLDGIGIIYNHEGAIEVEMGDIHEEYFKCTTIEYNDKVWFFNPIEGMVMSFEDDPNIHPSHAKILFYNWIRFPYATAQDTVVALNGDYAYMLVNGRDGSSICKIRMIDLSTTQDVGFSRTKMFRIKGLGGTSGSALTIGNNVIFPASKETFTYNTVTNEITRTTLDEAGVTADKRGFMLLNGKITVVAGNVLLRYNYLAESVELPLFEEETLTGTYVYNVCDETESDINGPIMLTENDPVDIFKGHMLVDTSGVSYVNKLNLFRSGGDLTEWFQVNLSADSVVPSFVDMKSDVSIAIAELGDYNQLSAPPKGLKLLTSHAGMLFGVVGHTLYYSVAGQADYWDEAENFLLMDRNIEGLVSTLNGLIVFMKGRIQLLMGDDVANFVVRTTTNDRGSTDALGIQGAMGGAVFFDDNGLCFTDGAIIRNLSYDLLGDIKFFTLSSCVTPRSYYALVNNFMDSPHTMLLLRYDLTIEKLTFSSLTGDEKDGVGIVDSRIMHSFNGDLIDTLGGNNERVFYYKSGKISNEQLTIVREWDRVRVTGTYIGKFIVYIDDLMVLNEDINTTEGRINMHIPKSMNKGKAITFEAIGQGIIASIEYSDTPRKTIK